MAYQINLTGQEIDERLQNIGTAEDVAAADGTLYARISKNADDVDELRDTVGHIDSAQTATDKTVTQHTADISALQTALKTKANLANGKVPANELPIATSLGNPNNGTIPSTFAVNEAINNKIVGLLHWQGVKSTTSEIKAIAPAKKGDVWHSNGDGSEWVCTQDITAANADAWTELGTPIDLSGYYTKTEVDKKVKPLADSIGTDNDATSANGSLYARIKKNATDIAENKGNVKVLIERVDTVTGTANEAKALTKVNEERLNSVQATANTALENSERNQDSVRNAQVTANEAKASVEGLTTVVRRAENYISQLKELNVVYPNNIRSLTTESTSAEVMEAFVPAIGGSAGVVNTPHVGYLIKGAAYEDSSEDDPEYGPDSTIISVDIIKTDNKDYHKFIYVDNNTAIISVTVDLANYKLIDKSTLTNIETTSKVGTLRDLYISAGAVYNEATGYYELNGLKDITEEEMRVIWQEDLSGWYLNGRTNLTRNIRTRSNVGGYNSGIDISNICENNSNITKFNFGASPLARYLDNAFSRCTKLETIDTRFPITPYGGVVGPNIFRNCPALKEVRFNMRYLQWSTNVNFPASPLISKDSILSVIQTTPTKGSVKPLVVVGLNESAYNRLKDDTDITAALTEKNGFVTLTQI